MSKYKLIGIYLLFVFFFGCKAKNIEKIETKERVELQMPSNNELRIDVLCDSLGNPVQLNKVLATKSGLTSLQIKNNSLVFKSVNDTIVVYKEKLVNKEVRETKFKWAKITWFFLGYIILTHIFPVIPDRIKKVFLRLIGVPF